MNDAHFPLFLTTAIPYVNARPHIGHALELLLGDALARHARQRGRAVRFTGGTDDHSTKNARAAEARGIATSELVREHGDHFRALSKALGVRFDDYLHTSRDARHAPCVQELWRRCHDAGDLYQSEYRGLYCAGCEAFVAEEELVDGKCTAHREEPEPIAERNWFFRLSRYQAPLLAALESGALRVEPRERHAEVLSFVRSGLSDFSVSRSQSRARGWGLLVPGDPSQVIYVWFDALASYLSLSEFPENYAKFSGFYEPGSAREHLIGKDVLRFHAVYWPAILLSAGLTLPTAIKTHGFVTAQGVKIGKSLGNTVSPFELVEQVGVSAVRFYFLRHLHSTKDSDFDLARLVQAHDVELAGKLGNLLQRTIALALRYPDLDVHVGVAAESDADRALREAAESALATVKSGFDDFALHRALGGVFELVASANRYADAQEPWTLCRRVASARTREAAADLKAQLAHVLWRLCEALRVTAVLLAPFLPKGAAEILQRLGVSAAQRRDLSLARFGLEGRFRPKSGPPLFPRLGVSAAAGA
ncbi:MAG: methionine--tRNA ligase [Myxococcales bacterium]|nr:MAG: methionine--tRNA ligase [Myxococcales bacterium]